MEIVINTGIIAFMFRAVHMFHAIWEFAQSRDCVAHSQNPEIAFQSRDCAANLEIA